MCDRERRDYTEEIEWLEFFRSVNAEKTKIKYEKLQAKNYQKCLVVRELLYMKELKAL